MVDLGEVEVRRDLLRLVIWVRIRWSLTGTPNVDAIVIARASSASASARTRIKQCFFQLTLVALEVMGFD